MSGPWALVIKYTEIDGLPVVDLCPFGLVPNSNVHGRSLTTYIIIVIEGRRKTTIQKGNQVGGHAGYVEQVEITYRKPFYSPKGCLSIYIYHFTDFRFPKSRRYNKTSISLEGGNTTRFNTQPDEAIVEPPMEKFNYTPSNLGDSSVFNYDSYIPATEARKLKSSHILTETRYYSYTNANHKLDPGFRQPVLILPQSLTPPTPSTLTPGAGMTNCPARDGKSLPYGSLLDSKYSRSTHVYIIRLRKCQSIR